MLQGAISMNIYTNHREVYKDHYGEIPRDIDGRSYDIHHIDGDHTNNNPTNLQAVTVQEHYNIHYAQGDYNACFKMAWRMSVSPEELSELARRSALQRVANGTHPWAGDNGVSRRKSRDGTHHWFGENNPSVIRTKNGTNNLLGPSSNLKRLAEGRHPSQMKKTCPHCDFTCAIGNYTKYHGDKCKKKP